MSVVLNGSTGVDAPGLSIDGVAVGLKADVQEFASSGTWTKPANAKLVFVELYGAGGGGGSGERKATGTNRAGGAGGGGGTAYNATFFASELPSTVSVTIGAGGAGGAAVTVNTTNGASGSAGGSSLFGSIATALGGTAGGGGASGSGNSGGQNTVVHLNSDALGQGANGGFSLLGAPTGGWQGGSWQLQKFKVGGTGGGGGGYIPGSTNVAVAAGLGGVYFANNASDPTGTAATGAGTSVNGAAGSAFGLAGGGGGAGTAANAGAGGAGATAAGGGGGGASVNGFNSGAGGAGGNGFCRVTTYS